VYIEFLYINKKEGTIINEYIAKYNIEYIGLLININLDIQPICVIDENAIIDFNLDWFIPIVDPTSAFNIGIIIINFCCDILNISIVRGASFCQVLRIIHEIHDMDVITDGNHIWQGAIPSLINSEKINKIMIRFLFIELSNHHRAEDIMRNILDPIACIKKYFSIASDSWNLFDDIIVGINEIILISRAVQANKRLFLDKTIKDLNIIIIYSNKLIGDKCVDIYDSHQ